MATKHEFNNKVARAVFITLLIVSAFALLILQPRFFILVFAGIFFAVLLNFGASWFHKKIKLPYGLSLLLVILLIFFVATTLILLIGPSVGDQIKKIIEIFPQSIEHLKETLKQTELSRRLMNELPENPEDLLMGVNSAKIYSQVMGSFATTIGVLTNAFIIFVIGIFMAASPSLYRNGLLKLFSPSFQPRLAEVLDKAHETLSLWMFAKLISMTAVAILTTVGLMVLGVPMPFALALIAALFTFIPTIGPFIGLIPAVLIGLMQGANMAFYVLILYLSIQIIEAYLITPMVEKRIVSLPPALTLLWLILFGMLTGIFGMILATPLLATIIVFVDQLYVKDYLGNKT
ncbi:MAG: AI-2E family transporter [Candidatus Kapaibacterium sp.]